MLAPRPQFLIEVHIVEFLLHESDFLDVPLEFGEGSVLVDGFEVGGGVRGGDLSLPEEAVRVDVAAQTVVVDLNGPKFTARSRLMR